MKRAVALLVLLSCTAVTAADDPREAFAKAWTGRLVVVKSPLYSLVFNERGRLGNTYSGRRDGLLVVTAENRQHLQFDGRQGRETVIETDAGRLVKAIAVAYQGNTLDVRSYRRLEPLAIEQFVPGSELVVSDVSIEDDEVKLEFELPEGDAEATTSLRVKWPVPLSTSFSERAAVENLLKRYVEIK